MSFSELAWKRRSVRSFTAEDVPVETIAQLLDAARSAPSAGNCQPWQFFAIKDSGLKELLCKASEGQRFIAAAPVVIVVCADFSRNAARYGERGRELYALQDTAAAIQNLLLCAADNGLGACWCGAFDEAAVSDALGLGDNERPVAVIPVGYAGNLTVERGRRSVDDICTFIGFDSPAEPAIAESCPKIEHANLEGALLSDLNLAHGELVNLNMEGCTISDVNMSDCVIYDARLDGAEIKTCNLTKLEITGCIIEGLTVDGVDISALLSKE